MFHHRHAILLIISCFLNFPDAISQDKKTTPATVVDIFSDLPIDDPSKNSPLAPGETAAEKISKNILVTAILNKTKCYLGEPVLLTFELLSALNSTSTIERLPSLDGFLTIHMDPNNDFPKFRQRNGLRFSVFVIKQIQLIPSREGNLEIAPISVNNEVTDKTDGKNSNYSGIVSSKPFSLQVLPLPAKGKPVSFTGSIGDFSVRSSVQLDSFPAGENNKLQIEINGSGNFFSLSLPTISCPAGFQNFELSEKSVMDEKAFPIRGKRIISIPFIADQAGNFTIAPIELNYFNPSTNRYRKSVTDAIEVVVLPAIARPGLARVEKPKSPGPAGNYSWLYALTGSLLLIALMIYVAFIINRRRHLKKAVLTEDAMKKEKEKALLDEKANRFNNSIANLENLQLDENYIVEFKRVLIDYLQEKLKMPGAWPGELIQSVKVFDGQTGLKMEQLVEECDLLLYAGITPDSAERRKLIAEMHIIFKKLDLLS